MLRFYNSWESIISAMWADWMSTLAPFFVYINFSYKSCYSYLFSPLMYRFLTFTFEISLTILKLNYFFYLFLVYRRFHYRYFVTIFSFLRFLIIWTTFAHMEILLPSRILIFLVFRHLCHRRARIFSDIFEPPAYKIA